MPHLTVLYCVLCAVLTCFVSFYTCGYKNVFLWSRFLITKIGRNSLYRGVFIAGSQLSTCVNAIFCKHVAEFSSMHCKRFIADLFMPLMMSSCISIGATISIVVVYNLYCFCDSEPILRILYAKLKPSSMKYTRWNGNGLWLRSYISSFTTTRPPGCAFEASFCHMLR